MSTIALARARYNRLPAPAPVAVRAGDGGAGAKRGEYGVFITMGPGAGVECALWRF